MQAFDTGLLWGGLVTYAASVTDQFVNAYYDWTNNIENYVNGSVIPFWSYMPDVGGDVILLAYEDITGKEWPSQFSQFEAIGEMMGSTLRIDTHKGITDELEIADGYR